MPEQYYTPELQDIHIGYECEIRWRSDREWEKKIISEDDINPKYTEEYIFLLDIRTPYLTREQIEAEGWVYWGILSGKGFPSQFDIYKRDGDMIHYCNEYHHLGIEIRNPNRLYHPNSIAFGNILWGKTKVERMTTYDGYCPSINELRRIMKMIGIEKK